MRCENDDTIPTLDYASRSEASVSPLSPLEWVVVLGLSITVFILGLAFAVPTTHCTGHPPVDVTLRMIEDGGFLATQLDLYRLHMGSYPASLDGLLRAPASPVVAEKWGGPYIRDPEKLKDGWGKRLQYRFPGHHNQSGYDLWSMGPDGIDGTGDDICNWSQ